MGVAPPGPRTLREPASAVRAFLIADVRGYTRFSEERGDEAATRLIDRFLSIARERVGAHAGAIVEVRGDEVLAVFDSPRQAVRAAVDLQSTLAAEQDPAMPLGVGIGIDVGEAVPLGKGYRGRALNLAARLCARARPREILVTSELVHLSGIIEGIRFEDRGPMRLKGISRPINLMAVTRSTAPEEGPGATGSIAERLEFRLLGPLEVAENGRAVPLGGPKQRLVLAHLLLATEWSR
jgi:class 3 adenylate cyclase